MAGAGVNPWTGPVSGPSAPTRRQGGSLNRRRLAGYAGTVAILVVALLLLAWVLSAGGAPSSTGPGPGLLTYRGAEPVANSSVSGYPGSPWVARLAVGIDSPVGATVPVNLSLATGLSCTLTPSSGTSTNVTVPAFFGNLSEGTSPLWEFAFVDASGTVALVSVTNGVSTVLGTLTGACATLFGLLSPIPANVIDSSVAAAAVAADARPLLTNPTNTSGLFVLTGGYNLPGFSAGPQWHVVYTTCSLAVPTSASGLTFNATVDAFSGAVVSNLTQTVSCTVPAGPTSVPLGTALSVGLTSSFSRTTSWGYNLTVLSAADSIAWGNLTVSVTNVTGSAVSGWTLTAVHGSVTVAVWDPTTSSWSGSPSQSIAVSDQLLLRSTSSLAGDSIVIAGAGSFTGTESIAL